MVRPRETVDPRALSQPTHHPTPPPAALAVAIAADPPLRETFPQLPDLTPVSAEVALNTPTPAPATTSLPPSSQTENTANPPIRPTPATDLASAAADEPPATLILPPPPADAPRDPELQRAADDSRAFGAPFADDPESQWRDRIERLLALARTQAVADAKEGRSGIWWTRQQVLDRLMRADGTHWQIVMDALADALADANRTPAHADDAPPAPTPLPDLTAGAVPTQEPQVAANTQRDQPSETLNVPVFVICRQVEGFGLYEPQPAADIQPGATYVLYWELEGLKSEHDGDWFRSRVRTTLELVSLSAPDRPIWQSDLGESEDRCRRPRRDVFANARWVVPESTPPGEYELRLRVEDRGNAHASSTKLTLRIR